MRLIFSQKFLNRYLDVSSILTFFILENFQKRRQYFTFTQHFEVRIMIMFVFFGPNYERVNFGSYEPNFCKTSWLKNLTTRAEPS